MQQHTCSFNYPFGLNFSVLILFSYLWDFVFARVLPFLVHISFLFDGSFHVSSSTLISIFKISNHYKLISNITIISMNVVLSHISFGLYSTSETHRISHFKLPKYKFNELKSVCCNLGNNLAIIRHLLWYRNN